MKRLAALAATAAAAALALAGTARAELTAPGPETSADRTLGTAPMSGPYDSAFDEKCADLRGSELHREATCARVRALRVGGLHAEIHRVGWGDGSGDYYLAIHTRTGWFVSDLPLQIETENGHAGHYDVGHVDSISVAEEQLAGDRAALSFQIRETWKTFCDECADGEHRDVPQGSFGQSATLVCSVVGGAPVCTAPLYTVGDDQRPPRVVGGKLIARGVELGEATEYGQEWHDLADGRYTIAL